MTDVLSPGDDINLSLMKKCPKSMEWLSQRDATYDCKQKQIKFTHTVNIRMTVTPANILFLSGAVIICHKKYRKDHHTLATQ